MRSENVQDTPCGEPKLSGTNASASHHRLGTPEWVEEVFSTPPVRDTKGRSKHTQHHDVPSLDRTTFNPAEGYEYVPVIMLDLLLEWKKISRWKAQPFKTDVEQFGSSIFPDFLVEIADTKEVVIVEMKSAKYLTRQKQRELETIRSDFHEAGLRYIVWTDRHPLCHPLRHHLVRMRIAESDEEHIDGLVKWVRETPHPTFSGLYDAGYGINDLYAATWKKRVFFAITKLLTEMSLISLSPVEDIDAMFLGSGVRADSWWHDLESW